MDRKLIIRITIGLFLLVTISHIAWFAGSFEPEGGAWLGWPYALGVELSIVVSAYFTRWKTTRSWAWACYFTFVAASGLLNWGYINPQSIPAMGYALFPTLAISLLGLLYRQADQFKDKRKRPEPERKQAESVPESAESVPEVPESVPESAESVPESAESVPEAPPKLPEGLPRIPESFSDFRSMVESGEAVIPESLTGATLAGVMGFSDRAGRAWLKKINNGRG